MQITERDSYELTREAEIIEGLLEQVGDAIGAEIDAVGYQAVSVQLPPGWTGTVVFEVSNDGITWQAKTLQAVSGGAQTSSVTVAGMWAGDLGARRFRVRSTVFTTGPVPVKIVFSAHSTSSASPSSQTVSGAVSVSGSGTTSVAKAEDAAHASGDLGVPSFAVRQPATPAVPTSAAGDYSYVLADSEGKQIPSGQGAPEVAFQSRTDLTTTSDVALRASVGAGLRTYIKDVVVENTGAAAVRFLLRDGTTTIFSVTVPAGSTFAHTFGQPIRGTAATAVNGQLGAAGTATVMLSGFTGV